MIFSRYRAALFLNVIFMTIKPSGWAQSPTLDELFLGLKDRAIIIDIAARIVEQNHEVVWNSETSRVTIPGRPVGIKLVGDNVVVAVQFIPFLSPRGNNFLVAQQQIWIEVPNKGISYRTFMQTVPLEFNEQIYFFPLGTSDLQEDAHIEIQLMLRPYTSEISKERQGNPIPP
jgi:hypothetical protein